MKINFDKTPRTFLGVCWAVFLLFFLFSQNLIVPQLFQSSGENQIAQVRAAASNMLLKKSSANPRYFQDASGKIIYLTGSHERNNLQQLVHSTDPLASFDFAAYLNILEQNNQHFIRGWAQEHADWQPLPYLRTGPGNALDGGLKFDLSRFNQSYFDGLRAKAIQAGNKGIYISLMLFNGWSVNNYFSRTLNVWKTHPFNKSNNINGIDGDLDGDGSGGEVQTLANPEITALQEAYVKKVIDTVNDLDTVLFEISNESAVDSKAWQYHMVDFIHNYEARKSKQHPVGMTAFWDGDADNQDLFQSPADWISPNGFGTGYTDNPPPADGSKVIIADTDHMDGSQIASDWAWKSYTRGLNVITLDGTLNGFDWPDPLARAAMSETNTYAKKMDLTKTLPRSGLCSTTYCLAHSGVEYLIYQPSSGTFSVNLETGNYNYEWFNPVTGDIVENGTITALGGIKSFTPPFSGKAVLYLRANLTLSRLSLTLP